MTGVQHVVVRDEEARMRLDRWFHARFPDLRHGQLQKMLRTGQIRVDGKRAQSSHRVAPGQDVRVPPLPQNETPAPRPEPEFDQGLADLLSDAVLFEDEQMVVLNKPPGLAVQGGSGITRSVDQWARARRPEPLRLVHRLDRDTSGVLVLARTRQTARRLASAFRGRAMVKEYWGVVAGVPEVDGGVIRLPVDKRKIGGQERMVAGGTGEGKMASTAYAVAERAGHRIAWLVLRPITGRTHQIRVHCAALATPILGDGKYGGAAAFVSGLPAPDRLHLHARRLIVPGAKGRDLVFEAPLPEHMAATFAHLEFDADADLRRIRQLLAESQRC